MTQRNDGVLNIAEIPYPSGKVQFRYSRYLAKNGSEYIRHGLFVAYHENGIVASEVVYEHGIETGPCRDYYPNGQLAAEGVYLKGKEHGLWRYWNQDGQLEQEVEYRDGIEQASS